MGISCTVRISLKDGTFHEDVGYGSSENQRSKAIALGKVDLDIIALGKVDLDIQLGT